MNNAKMFSEILQMNSLMIMTIGTIAIGGLIIILGFILGRRSRCDKTKNVTEIKVKPSEFNNLSDINAKTTTNNTAVNPSGSGGVKRPKKKRREAQQDFTHTWMLGALKAHTGPVLDMNFASNGKFLASCAEDCGLAPKDVLEDITSGGSKTAAPTGYYEVSQKISNSGHLDDNGDNGDDKSEGTSTISSGSSTTSTSSLSTKDSNDSPRPARKQSKNRSKAARKRRQENHQCLQKNFSSQNYNSGPSYAERVKNPTPRQEQNVNKKTNGRDNKVESVVNVKVDNNGAKMDEKHVNTLGQTIQNIMKLRSIERILLRQYTDAEVKNMLTLYLISCDTLKDLGYPHADAFHTDRAKIRYRAYHTIQHRTNHHRNQKRHHLDVNAREFVPSNYITQCEVDSGTGSGGSQESSDLEVECEFSPAPSRSESAEDIRNEKYFIPVNPIIERKCVRCSNAFNVDGQTGEYCNKEECIYHWGKFRNGPTGGFWNCCDDSFDAPGCVKAKMHVWSGLIPEYTGHYLGYVQTQPCSSSWNAGDGGVYAVDCEMCYTKRGLELCKVTVVDIRGNVVYDTFVKPDVEIIDYNTRFSGITAEHLHNVTTTLHDVQQHLTTFISSETILMGHALENDLRALKIIHTKIIDTSVSWAHKFPFFETGPYYGARSSLKTLAKRELQREIQAGQHNSVEDAQIVIDIVLRRLRLHIYNTTTTTSRYNYGENCET